MDFRGAEIPGSRPFLGCFYFIFDAADPPSRITHFWVAIIFLMAIAVPTSNISAWTVPISSRISSSHQYPRHFPSPSFPINFSAFPSPLFFPSIASAFPLAILSHQFPGISLLVPPINIPGISLGHPFPVFPESVPPINILGISLPSCFPGFSSVLPFRILLLYLLLCLPILPFLFHIFYFIYFYTFSTSVLSLFTLMETTLASCLFPLRFVFALSCQMKSGRPAP